MKKVIIETSARHIHLSKEDFEALFGKGYKLKQVKKLSQSREFAAEETVDIVSNDAQIKDLRIVGPFRSHTQIEISKSDSYRLKIDPPIKECTAALGEPAETIKIKGPKGEIERESVIIAQRHIHMNPDEAKKLGLKNHQLVSVRSEGDRAVTFHNVLIRVEDDFHLAMHIDVDEANACGIKKEAGGKIIN